MVYGSPAARLPDPRRAFVVWTWRTSGNGPTAFPDAAEDLRRAGSMRPGIASEFLAARRGARIALSTLLGVDRAAVDLRTERNRRPRVGDGMDVSLSLSRTRGYAALAAGPADAEIGVDIERVTRLSEISGAFSADEGRRLAELPEEVRDLVATRCWTVKEGIAKAMGTGLAVDPSGLETSLDDDLGAYASTPSRDGRAWRTLRFEVAEGVVGALVVRGGDAPFSLLSLDALGAPAVRPGRG